MNFFLVESPLQLLNALEARYFFNIDSDESTLIIFEGVSKKNFKQIQAISGNQEWGKIVLMNKKPVANIFPKSIKQKINDLFLVREVDELLDSVENANQIFIGEYRSEVMRHFAHTSDHKDCILLDDGNYSLKMQKAISNKESMRATYSTATKLFHKLSGIKDGDIFDIKYFTIYNNSDSNRKTYNNSYSHIRSKIQTYSKMDTVYFLGNNTPELGIIDLEIYLEALEAVKRFYSDKEVIYIPHRRESEEKLQKISSKLFNVTDFNLPVEWAIIENKKMPAEIASFFSSALDNCYLIFGNNIKIKAFRLASKLIANERRDLYCKSYKNYESYGDSFQIVNI